MYTAKGIFPAIHYTDKMEGFNFKNGHFIQVLKCLKKD